MPRFESSSALYEELFERVRDSFIAGKSWQEAIYSFAHAGPLSGDITRNQSLVAELRAAAPLSALMPVKLVGPDGLPILEAVTDEEKFEYELVRVETQQVEGNARKIRIGGTRYHLELLLGEMLSQGSQKGFRLTYRHEACARADFENL